MLKAFTKNLSYLMLSRIVFRLFWAFMLIVAARYLGADLFGQLETARALVDALIIFSGLGMSMLMIQIGSRNPEKLPVLFGNALFVNIAMAAAIYVGLLLAAPLFGYEQIVILLIGIIGLAQIAFEVRKPIRALFQIRLKMRSISIIELLNGLLTFSLVLGVTYFFDNPTTGLIAIAVVQLLGNGLMFLGMAGFGLKEQKPKLDLRILPGMLKKSAIFSLYLIFFQLYFQIDQIMLSLMDSDVSVGLYAAPAKLIVFLLIIPEMVNQLLSPIMYRLGSHDQKKYKRIHWTFHRYLVGIGFPIAVGTFLLSEPIIKLVYGNGYLDAAPALQIFGIFIFFLFLGNACGNNLTTLDKQPLRTGIQVGTIALKVILNFLFIPIFGFIGAAITTTITEAVHKLAYIGTSWYLLKGGIWETIKPVLHALPAVIMMSIFVLALKDTLPVLILVVLSAFIYLAGLILFRFFTNYDKKLMRELLSKTS